MKKNYTNDDKGSYKSYRKDKLILDCIAAIIFSIIMIGIYFLVKWLDPKPIEPTPTDYDTFIVKRDSLKDIIKELNVEENEAIKNIDSISNDSVYKLFKELVSH